MKFFPLTLHHKSTSTLLTVWSYWFLSPIGIEGNTHLICGFTQSMVVLWDIMLFHTSSSFLDWLKCTDIDHRFQSIACLSSSMKSFSVTCPLSHFPVVWSIQSLPVRRLTSYGHSTAPDYIFIWSFAVSQWLSVWLCLTGMKVFKLSFSGNTSVLNNPNNSELFAGPSASVWCLTQLPLYSWGKQTCLQFGPVKVAENLLHIRNGYTEIGQMLIMSFGDNYYYENRYNVLDFFSCLVPLAK